MVLQFREWYKNLPTRIILPGAALHKNVAAKKFRCFENFANYLKTIQ